MARLPPLLLPPMLPALLVAALLGGCTLIDQRTFNPRAGMGPPVPPGPGPTPALITIDFDKPAPAYEAPLREAVDSALGRKPDVTFDVVTAVPATGTPAQQVAAAGSIRGDARDVARVIADQGIDPARIHLQARADPAATARQIQVYVH